MELRERSSRWLPASETVRSVSLLAGGTAVGQAVVLLASPVLTRLYSVADFGFFQAYVSVLGLLIVLGSLRYENAILLPEEDSVAARLLVLTILVGAVTSLAAASVPLWIPGLGSRAAAEPVSRSVLVFVLPLAMWGAIVYQALSYWALRGKRFRDVATTKLTQVVSQVSVQLLVGSVWKVGAFGLVLGDALGRLTGSFGLARSAFRRTPALFREIRPIDLWRAAVRYRRFPLISTASALLNTAGFALPPLLLARFYGAQTLGWYALVDRVAGAPAILVGQAISQVYMTRAARLAATEPRELHSLFLRTWRRLLLLGALPTLLIAGGGPLLFSAIFGQPWGEAGHYARLLVLMHYAGFAVWPLMPTLNLLERQDLQLRWDAARLVASVGALVAAAQLGQPARIGVAVFGAAMALGYVGYVILALAAIRRRVASGAEPGAGEVQG
jgi:O-antigen/teichoic acid export membrane protein